jgi:hypothetical protein
MNRSAEMPWIRGMPFVGPASWWQAEQARISVVPLGRIGGFAGEFGGHRTVAQAAASACRCARFMFGPACRCLDKSFSKQRFPPISA